MKSKILVVDDEEHIRELIRFYLDKEGFSVFVTSNPLDEQSAQEDQQDTDKVHYRTDPG